MGRRLNHGQIWKRCVEFTPGRGGGGLLPYMGYHEVCSARKVWFLAVLIMVMSQIGFGFCTLVPLLYNNAPDLFKEYFVKQVT